MTLERREKRNLILFILSYVLNNLASGVLYDTYVNYLQEVSLPTATSFWSFYGYATFISAAMLLLVPKIGYKRLLLFCGVVSAASFFCVIYIDNQMIFYIATMLALTGIQLHYIMLAPYVATYTSTKGEKNIGWYTRTYYMGYVGYFLTTYLGGVLAVKFFSMHAGITYTAAKKLTAYVTDMAPEIKASYMAGNEDVLLITGFIAALALIPAFLIKEEKVDYMSVTISEQDNVSIKEKASNIMRLLFKKEAIFYFAYWTMISFAMGLFTSYYTVFLNRNLHIDKATSSLLVSISYIAIILFMFFSPKAVEKMGSVGTIFFSVVLSVPFMLIISNGDKFGSAMVPAVGVALFMRAGLANLSSPAESALSMVIAPKHLRPAFTSIVNFLAGFISILSGIFTGNVLFVTQEGYRTAYYIAGVIYLCAAFTLFFGLRKYNRKINVDGDNEAEA